MSGFYYFNYAAVRCRNPEFFIEQPIAIEATGDYHAFGSFVSGIAALPRIVTLHDFEITASENKEKKSDIPQVNYNVKAKTYRYIGVADAQATATPATGTQATDANSTATTGGAK